MKIRSNFIAVAVLLMCSVGLTAPASQRDPLGHLKRSITEAGAAALTTEQETQLNDLVKNFQQSLPQSPDAALKAARTAYNAAILTGDLAAAQAQVSVIAARTTELSNARLQAEAKFKIQALAVLKTGGQLDALKQKFGEERLLGLVGSLFGGFGGGRPGHGPGFGPADGAETKGFRRPRPGNND